MPSNSPSRHSTVAVFSATVVAAATIGSGFVAYFNGNTYQAGTQEVTTASGSTVTAGGGAFQATNLAGAACLKDTSGRYRDCYQKSTLTNTGACVAGGCATKAYVVASIPKPFTGTGVIKNVDVTCDGQGRSGRIWINQGATATAATSGSSLLNLAGPTISSGSSIVFSTGSTRWSELTPFLNLYAGVDVDVSGCLFSVTSDEVYNP